MKVWGVSIGDVQYAKERATDAFNGNLRFNREPEVSGRAVSFTLRVFKSKEPGAHLARGGRRTVAACWHAHLEVMRELFKVGATRVLTAFADYRSAEDLEEKKWITFRRNVGSMFEPAEYGALCECQRHTEYFTDSQAHKITFGTLTREGGLGNIRLISQSDIRRCPHVILVPEHYREDGSCKCNDPNAAEMAEWGYTWKEGAWRWEETE